MPAENNYILWPIINETNSQNHTKGSLIFSKDYKLFWTEEMFIKSSDFSNKNLNSNKKESLIFSSDKINEIGFVCDDFGNIYMSFNYEENSYIQLKIPKEKIISLFILFKGIVEVGLCFPIYQNRKFLLIFNKNFQGKPVFENIAKQMIFSDGADFRNLFISLINYLKDLILEFPIEIGINVKFNEIKEWADKPLKAVSLILVENILEEVENEYIGVKKITKDDIDSLFDQNGKIKEPEMLKYQLFLAGCENETLEVLLPFILDIYDWKSSKEDREKLEEEWESECNILLEQLEVVFETKNNKLLRGYLNVIKNDIMRTDRKNNAFLISNGKGMELAILILNLYLVFNTSYGYIQGLNDHVAEIIYIYFPYWNEKSEPIDKEGNVINNYKSLVPKLFELFKAEIQKLKFNKNVEINNVSKRALEIEKMVYEYLDEFAPFISFWIKSNGITNLLFLYTDIHLLFRRSIDNIWDLWVHLFTSPVPEDWIVLIFTSYIICSFNKWENDPGFFTTIDLHALEPDIEKVKKVAVWLYNKKKLNSTDSNKKENHEFKFFKSSLH